MMDATSGKHKKTVLHIASGPLASRKLHESFCGDEWREVRLDSNPGTSPDLVAEITSMPLVEDGFFDALYSAHSLIRLAPHEVPRALREFRRVLKPQGHALISVPDLQTAAEHIAAGDAEKAMWMTNMGPVSPMDILYGFRPLLATGPHMAHRVGFTVDTLRAALVEAGFLYVEVERDWEFNLWAVASPASAA